MKMTLNSVCLLDLAILAATAFGPSSACTQQQIQICSNQMTSGILGSSPDMITSYICSNLILGFTCMRNAIADCEGSMQTFALQIAQRIRRLEEICKDPSSINASEIANCPYQSYGRCLLDTVQGTTDRAKVCLAYGKMEDCLEDFQVHCGSELMNAILSFQEPMFEMAKDECRMAGYSTEIETTDPPIDQTSPGGADGLKQVVLLPLLTSALAAILRHFL